MIEQLISRVFYSRNIAHFLHWQSQSFAQHSALGEFYDEVISALDGLVEAYQGTYALVGDIPVPDVTAKDILSHLEAEIVWIQNNHEAITKGNKGLGNLVDTISNVYQSTVYKLRNLH
jgi:hypothetical protein